MIHLKQRFSTPTLLLLFLALVCALAGFSCDTDQSDNGDSDDDVGADDDDDDSESSDDDDDDDDSHHEALLLEKFQPLLIQKFADDYQALPYPATSDRIGQCSLHTGDPDYDFAVRVDTEQPVMYTSFHKTAIFNREHVQLIYAFFYPERPNPYVKEENFFDYFKRWIWSGLIDGKVIRITLDQSEQVPLLIEVARNCGCDWKLYVNKIVEDSVREQFEKDGQPFHGLIKPNSPSDVDYVFVMPDNLAQAKERIVFVAEDGWTQYPHNPLGVFTSFEQWSESDVAVPTGALYVPDNQDLEPDDVAYLEVIDFAVLEYDVLYDIIPEGQSEPVGIFDGLGYVWNSYSPLTKWMLDQCCFSRFPGTPRDRDHLEVVHETMDYWDATTLYDTFIHLPEAWFDPN